MKIVTPKPLIIMLHLLIIVAAYSSVFWLDWILVAHGVALYLLQILIFRGCVLTIAQFGHARKGFIPHYIERLFHITLPEKSTYIFMNFILPVVFVVLAYYLQEIIGILPAVDADRYMGVLHGLLQ